MRVNHLELSGDLSIDLGDGRRNGVSILSTHVDGVMSIYRRRWSDSIRLIRSAVGSLKIDTAGGADRVTTLLTRVSGDADINLGDGSDRLSLMISQIGGTATVDGGSGSDRSTRSSVVMETLKQRVPLASVVAVLAVHLA